MESSLYKNRTKAVNDKISQLKNELSVINFVGNKLLNTCDEESEIDFLYFVNMWDGTENVVFKCKNTDETGKILNAFKPCNDSHILNTKKEEILHIPYEVKLHTYIKSTPTLTIKYKHSGKGYNIDISIEVPASVVKDHIRMINRSISSNEYHYFSGLSLRQLQNTEVLTAQFRYGRVITYGDGAHCQQADTKVISEIVQRLRFNY